MQSAIGCTFPNCLSGLPTYQPPIYRLFRQMRSYFLACFATGPSCINCTSKLDLSILRSLETILNNNKQSRMANTPSVVISLLLICISEICLKFENRDKNLLNICSHKLAELLCTSPRYNPIPIRPPVHL